jgi:hypothetical protein
MPNNLSIVFVGDGHEIEKVLNALNYGNVVGHLMYSKPSDPPQELDRATDGIRVKAFISTLGAGPKKLFYIEITESDIDELIGEYISDKSGVPFYDMTKKSDEMKVNNIIASVIPFGGSYMAQRPSQQPAQNQRTSPTQKKLDTVLKAMPNDNFVQSLDQQYKRRRRLTPKQQSALQKIYDRVTNPSSVQIDPNMKARIDALVKLMPRDRFVKSLSDQYDRRGELSPKQFSALEKIEKGIASGGDKALIQRVDVLLKNPKIKGRRKSLLTSFKEQLLNGRKLSQRQQELLSEYEQL